MPPVPRDRKRLHAVLAIVVGVALPLLALPLPASAFAALLAPIVVAVVMADIERGIIPDAANAAMFVLGLGLVLTEAGRAEALPALGDALARAVAAGGSLYLLRLAYWRATGAIGLGLGDVKLAAAGAPFLAWATLPLALAIAAIAGLLAAVFAGILRGEALDRGMTLPFGAFLAPAIWLSLVCERTGLLPL